MLYQRWGSYPNFQRTRGVLRLLSLVIHSLKEKELSYISLADFDLNIQELRRELIKHIGEEYDSVIAADITGDEAGAKKVDFALGDSYKGLKLGSRAATTVFLYSFSGGAEKGATLGEIKRNAVTTGIPSSVVTEAATDLQTKLFYLRREGEKYYFTNQPNLNRLLLTRMENIRDSEINEFEEVLIKRNLSTGRLNTTIWPRDGAKVADNADLKLVILNEPDHSLMEMMLETKGNTPRVNRNTLFFLTTLAHERSGFYNQLKKTIAYRGLKKADATLNLSDEQRKDIRDELRTAENSLDDMLRRYYRSLFIPTRDGLKETDLGVPTYGATKKLDEVAYEKLRSDGEILEQIAPLLLRERYLGTNDFASTEQLYQSSAKTPGSLRIISKSVWESGIREGVEKGLFGLGELQDGKPACLYFKERPGPIAFAGNEVIIRDKLCLALKDPPPPDPVPPDPDPVPPDPEPEPEPDERDRVQLKFNIPKGKVSGIMGVMNLLQSNFDNLQVELRATGGQMSNQDYEDKIKEAFVQLEIDLKE